tara:strand:+ start:824 stop:1003 length:180 start_codon:yes stop_codon:yes gene_type:complete
MLANPKILEKKFKNKFSRTYPGIKINEQKNIKKQIKNKFGISLFVLLIKKSNISFFWIF